MNERSSSAPLLVILAAGESARLGACKALVALSDSEPSTPLSRLAAAGAALGSERIVVVTGADDHLIRAACERMELRVLWNEHWSAGRTGAVLLAQRAFPERDLCLAPVDVPLVSARVFAALRATWDARQRPARGWLAPSVAARDAGAPQGRRFGHPIVVGRALLAELRETDRGLPLHRLRERADPLLGVEVDDEAILDDLDAGADLESLRARLRADSEKKSR